METPGLAGRVLQWWGKLPAAQKLLLGGLVLAAGFAVVIWVFVSRPSYIPLDTGAADARDAAEVTAKLKELKVPYRLGADGLSILVPAAEKPAAVLALAQAGLPRGGAGGYELWDSQKFGATDQDRRVLFKRAMEGELSRAITRLVGVQYANVKLALPEPSLFITQEKAATAAVIVGTRPGYSLTPVQVAGVVRFISGAVEGMRPESVTVIDERGRVLSAGLSPADNQGASGAEGLKAQLAAQDELQRKLQALLEPVFGPGNVVAQVALTLNWDKVTTESTTVGNTAPTSVTTTSRDVNSTGGAATTVIDQGVGSNVAGGPANGGVPSYQTGLPAGGTTVISESASTTTNAVSSEKKTVLTGPGSIKTISVGILVNGRDGAAALSTDQASQVRSTVAKATGAALADVSIAAVPFSQDLQKLLAGDSKPTSPWSAPLLVGLAVAVGAMALMVLFVRRRTQPAVAYSEMVPALGGIQAPEPSTELPDPAEAAAALHAEEELETDRILTEMARNLENPARNRLKLYVEHMAKKNPELVASLLRSWLSED